MSFASLPLADLIRDARTLYTGARDTPDAAALLADYYTVPDDFDAGLTLVADVVALDATQKVEYADQFAATSEAQRLTEEVKSRYSAHRRISRRAHARDSEGHRALALSGDTPNGRADLLRRAGTFWQTIVDRPDLVSGVRGLDAARAQDALALLETARTADDAQTQETGQAQRATDARDTQVAQLRRDAGELAEIAHIALSDRPQLLETLGLMDRR